jgi:hypothetical protein
MERLYGLNSRRFQRLQHPSLFCLKGRIRQHDNPQENESFDMDGIMRGQIPRNLAGLFRG